MIIVKQCNMSEEMQRTYDLVRFQIIREKLERVVALPVKKIFPGHHSLDIKPEILIRMWETFRKLKADGKLHLGSGMFAYGDWGVWF